MDAVIALRSIVDAYSDDHLDDMKPHLPSLLEHLFRLMSEVSLGSSLIRLCIFPKNTDNETDRGTGAK